MKYLIVASVFLIGSLTLAQREKYDFIPKELYEPIYIKPEETIEINPWDFPSFESVQMMYDQLKANEYYNRFSVQIYRDPAGRIVDFVGKDQKLSEKYLNDTEFINTIAAPSIKKIMEGVRIDLNNQILNQWDVKDISDAELLKTLRNPKENQQRRLQNIKDNIADMQEAIRNNRVTPIKREFKFIYKRRPGFFGRLLNALERLIDRIESICISIFCIHFKD